MWTVGSNLYFAENRISMRRIAAVLEVLGVEGRVVSEEERGAPTLFWLAVSDRHESLRRLHSSVDEAHARAEMQLPKQDVYVESTGVDLDNES